MTQFDPTDLAHFTGTTAYDRISHRHLLTDGTKYVAEAAGAYWLMDAAASHLDEIGTEDWFSIIKLTVKDSPAVLIYEVAFCHSHKILDTKLTQIGLPTVQ